MKRKWSKWISGAICVSMALPDNVVYAGALQLDNVQDYSTELKQFPSLMVLNLSGSRSRDFQNLPYYGKTDIVWQVFSLYNDEKTSGKGFKIL